MSDSCKPKHCSLPGSSALGILQARTLEWVAISFSKGSSWPRNRTRVSCIVGRFFASWATRKVQPLKIHSTKTRRILVTKIEKYVYLLCGSGIFLQFRRPGFDLWVGKISWRRERLPTPVFWPGLYRVHGITKRWTWLSDFHFQNEFCHVFNLNVSNLTIALFIFQKFNEKPQKHRKTTEQMELRHYMFHIF